MSSETPALRTLLQGDLEKTSLETDIPSKQQEKLREVFRVTTVSEKSTFISQKSKADQRDLKDFCVQYLGSHFDNMEKVDPDQEIAQGIIAAYEKPAHAELPTDIFTSFEEKVDAQLRKEHLFTINDLKLARDIAAIDTSLPESWTYENLKDLAALGMPESLIFLISDSYKASHFEEQLKANKNLFKMLRPINAVLKRKEIIQAAQKAQKRCLEVSTNKALTTYTKSLQFTFLEISKTDSFTGLSTPEKVSQYQSLLESIRLVLDQTKDSPAILNRTDLLKLQKSIIGKLEAAKKTAVEYDTRGQQKKKNSINDIVIRITDKLRYSSAKLTQEVFVEYNKALNQLESDYTKIDNKPENDSVFSRRIIEARKILHEKKWTTYDLGDPQKIREKIYTTYQNKKIHEDEKTAREWLKMALDVLKEIVDQQKDAFVQSWEVVWSKLEKSDGYIEPFSREELGQIFFENGCNFSIYSLNIPEILQTAVDTHNATDELLRTIRWNPVEVFRLLQPEGLARDPIGKVEIDRKPPILAVRLICHDPHDFTLLSNGFDPEDDSQASTAFGVTFEREKTFKTPKGAMKAPLILVNAARNKSPRQLMKTVKHENAHQKILIKSDEGTSYIREEQVRMEETPPFDIHPNNSPLQQEWRKNLNQEYKQSALDLRNEIQAFTEEFDFDFSEIQKALLETGTGASYEYIANNEWQQKYLNKLAGLKLSPEERNEQKKAFFNDVEYIKAKYEERVKRAIYEAEKLTKTFPPTTKGREYAGLLLRFTTFKEQQILNRYFS